MIHCADRCHARTLLAAAVLLTATAPAALADRNYKADDHFALAALAMREQNPGEAWRQARLALRLDPQHAEATRLFTGFWRAIDLQKGAMNVGRLPEQVAAVMGPPDARRADGATERWDYAFMAVVFHDRKLYAVVDTRNLPPHAWRARQRLDVQHDGRDWQINHRQIDRANEHIEYTLPDESVQSWRELLSAQRMIGLGGGHVTLKQLATGMKQSFLSRVPDGQWRLISSREDEITYEFIVPESSPHGRQHEVARVVRGEYDIHRVAYVRKGKPMSDGQRAQWLAVLGRSQLKRIEHGDHAK